MAKKTNYIAHEIERLEAYISQIRGYLDSNPPDRVEDRIEIIPMGDRSIVKVIASKETQVKQFMAMVEKLPALLESLNRLRKIADDQPEEKQLRAGYEELPGFMEDDDEDPEEL